MNLTRVADVTLAVFLTFSPESEPKAITDSQVAEATSVPEPEEQLEAEVKPQLQSNRRKKVRYRHSSISIFKL